MKAKDLRCFPRLVVRKSAIHGKGLFAGERIAKGTHIGTFEGTPTGRNGRYVLWIVEEHGREIGIRCTNELRHVNHSHDPNTECDGIELYAIRDIQPGEEITLHYGDEWE